MEFLEIPLFDDDVYKLGVRFSINLVFLILLLVFAIQPNQREREFAFSAVMMNVTVFFICFTLKKLDIGLGMALGLFAIFGILRYRADAISTKEMTYLFIVIGVAVINSLSNKKTSYVELFLVNFVIIGVAMLKETILFRSWKTQQETQAKEAIAKSNRVRKLNKLTVNYDRLEWLGPEHQGALLADLTRRTGMEVEKFRVQNVDLQQNIAMLQIWVSDPNEDKV